jgi:hypothetical protein
MPKGSKHTQKRMSLNPSCSRALRSFFLKRGSREKVCNGGLFCCQSDKLNRVTRCEPESHTWGLGKESDGPPFLKGLTPNKKEVQGHIEAFCNGAGARTLPRQVTFLKMATLLISE